MYKSNKSYVGKPVISIISKNESLILVLYFESNILGKKLHKIRDSVTVGKLSKLSNKFSAL